MARHFPDVPGGPGLRRSGETDLLGGMRVRVLLWCLISAVVTEGRPCGASELVGRLVDASGAPVPGRVYIRNTESGDWYPCESAEAAGTAVPYSVKRFERSVETHTTVSAHPFRAELPPGTYRLMAERGTETIPAEATVVLQEGATAEVTLELARWVNLAERGWFSGDTHVHRPVAELPNLLLAEDLNVALPLTYWVTKSGVAPAAGDKTSLKERAQALIRVDDRHVIYPVNSEYEIFTVGERAHTLGAIFVLNHRSPLPLGAPPVKPIAELAREQDALLDLDKHNWPWSLMLVPVMDVDLFELTNNHIWRTEFGFRAWQPVGAPEFMRIERDAAGWSERGWIDFGLETYYLLLNCGFRMRPSAGTASGVHPVPLGFGRVYVHLPDGFTYDKWIKGLDAGRSFVTTGPVIDVRVGSIHGMGATLEQPAGSRTVVDVTASWPGHLELQSLELVINGRALNLAAEAGSAKTQGGANVLQARREVPVNQTTWIAARAFCRTDSRWREHAGGSGIRFAHSSPIWIDVPDKPLLPSPEGIAWLIERMETELARSSGILDDPALDDYRQALGIYREIQSRIQHPGN